MTFFLLTKEMVTSKWRFFVFFVAKLENLLRSLDLPRSALPLAKAQYKYSVEQGE